LDAPSLSFAELYARARARVPDKVRLHPGHISRRSPTLAAVLTVATLGTYGIYWLYRVSRELRDTTAHREVRPGRDVALTLLTLGLYGVVVVHRQSRMIHAVSRYFERSHKDRSWETLTFAVGGVLSLGLLGALAVHVVQTQMNDLADLTDARQRDRDRRAARVLTPESRPSLPTSSTTLLAAPASSASGLEASPESDALDGPKLPPATGRGASEG